MKMTNTPKTKKTPQGCHPAKSHNQPDMGQPNTNMTTAIMIVGQADTDVTPKSTLETIPVPEYDPKKKLPKGYVSPFACLVGRAVPKNRIYTLKNRWPMAHFTPSSHESLRESIRNSRHVGDYVICDDDKVMKRGLMAPLGRLSIPETEQEYQARILQAEKEAILDALEKNLKSKVYETLREESGLEVKLSFTVSVDRVKHSVKSTVSGSIPIKSSSSSEFEDPDQMVLDL